MKKLTIYECHSLGDRSPLSMCDTLAGAAAFISSYASMSGWQIAFWQIDEDHPDRADAILKRDGKTRVFCAEPNGF